MGVCQAMSTSVESVGLVKVTLPEMGESVTEGSIVEWRRKVGDYVAEGDALVDVTTDKVDVEVPATATGIITQILANEGDTVPIGAALAEIDTAKSDGKPAASAPAETAAPQRLGPPKLVEVALPEMGESVTEGSIVEIRKHAGDYVNEGETVLDVTTDKVDVEIPAPASGAIVQLFVAPGDTVAVGAKLAEIDVNAAPASVTLSLSKGAATPSAALRQAQGDTTADQPARRMAKRLDVDLALVRGSGPNGLILRADVIDQAASAKRRPAATAAAALPLPPIPSGANVTPLKGPAAALTG